MVDRHGDPRRRAAGGAARAASPTACWRSRAASPIRAGVPARRGARWSRSSCSSAAGAAWASQGRRAPRRHRRVEELHRAGRFSASCWRKRSSARPTCAWSGASILAAPRSRTRRCSAAASTLYVEYSGTALTAIFNQPPSTDSNAVFAQIRDRYAALGVTALPRLGFNNTFAILVRAADARAAGLEDDRRPRTRVPPIVARRLWLRVSRAAGRIHGPGAAYGLQFADQPRVMDLNLIYRAVAAGEIDVTAGDATSGLIESLDLVVLDDDRRYFPALRRRARSCARAMLLQHPRDRPRRCGGSTARFRRLRCGA